jgi:hypothetical protein
MLSSDGFHNIFDMINPPPLIVVTCCILIFRRIAFLWDGMCASNESDSIIIFTVKLLEQSRWLACRLAGHGRICNTSADPITPAMIVVVKITFRWSGAILLQPLLPPSSFPEHYYDKRYKYV